MDVKRLVVIKTRGLGDTLLATPALHALREAYPAARFTAVVSLAGREVLAGNPEVDDVWVYNKRAGLDAWWALVRELRKNRFDLAVVLHASWRTAWLARLSRAPWRVVHNHSGRNYFSTLPMRALKESKSAIQRDLDAVRALGIDPKSEHLVFKLDEGAQQFASTFLRGQGLGSHACMILAPGAGLEKKRWTEATAAKFLDRITAAGSRRWVVLAGPEEQRTAARIRQSAQCRPVVFSGSLKEAAALMAQSQGMVTMDSGPKHLAVAMQVPTLTLWTDEPEAEWHPYDLQQHALLRSATGRVADIPAEAVVEAVLDHFQMRK